MIVVYRQLVSPISACQTSLETKQRTNYCTLLFSCGCGKHYYYT